jgi:hypothetical protein
MGVIARSITSVGIVTGLACTAVLGVGEAGCGSSSKQERSRQEPESAASVRVSLSAVEGPIAPSRYRVPRRAVRVSSSSQLVAALADGRRTAIVLAPGIYDNARPFSDREGDRIYSSRLGRAVSRAGIVLGANDGPPGALIRGLRFDVAEQAKTLHGAIVHVWGSAVHASVLDTRLDGHGVVDAGVVVRQPKGFVGRRIVATSFQSYGIVVDPNDVDFRTRSPFSLRDVSISRVARPVPGSSNGRAEACLWLGSPGTVRRVRARSCAITGIWTGTATRRSLVEDATVDRARVGIYIEHFTSNTTFERLRIGPDVRRGINAEWANHALGGRPASVDNVIQDAHFRTAHVGVYLDQGTTRTLVRRCRFVGQDWAAIGDFRGVDNHYYDNDFSGLTAGAVPISHDHDPAGGAKR